MQICVHDFVLFGSVRMLDVGCCIRWVAFGMATLLD
jgi:hypothetical protein